MNRLNIDILGVSETWLPDSGELLSEGTKIYYSANNTSNHRKGVVYAPTADKSEDEVDSFYSEIAELLKLTKPHEINLIIGDFNSKVGLGKVENIVGPSGLGVRNERGDRLIQFCQEESLKITNTFGTSITKVTTYPGADVPSNHNLLVAKLKIKLTQKRQHSRHKQLDLEKLNNDNVKNQSIIAINTDLKMLNLNNTNVDELWNQTKNVLKTTANRVLGTKRFTLKQQWVTEEIFQLMEERRKHRHKNENEYKRIHRIIRSKIREAKNNWLKKECEEIEHFQHVHDHFKLHKKIKEMSGVYRKSKSSALMNEQNQIISDPIQVQKTWRNYIEKLFSDTTRPIELFVVPSETRKLTGPSIKKRRFKTL
ncbi:uncharacterized protein LOC129608089 [Condylostylus longicornis]|uniref:uncharacterized protein LOC129608089 n=1 Tax=Condylostylus longicornis TaxID=2530218 RepID=UPI00244DA865|nr:uncharacterized protein LOC129608089 [Condylostylus longicornis]